MFNSLFGTISAKMPQNLYLDTGNIEWDIAVSDITLENLPPVGNTTRVYIWLQHREDSMKLFGFSSVEERNLFLNLLKVDGVGSKGALKIMSGISGEQLEKALDSEDLAQLEKLPGIGKKTAQKMLLALKGKLAFSTSNTSTKQNPQIEKWQDVITALTQMGYDKKSCEDVVINLASDLENEFNEKSRSEQEELLFRRAIVELA